MKHYKVTRTYLAEIPERGTPEFAKIQKTLIEEWGYESQAEYEYSSPEHDVTTEKGLALTLSYMSDVGDGVEGARCDEIDINVKETDG